MRILDIIMAAMRHQLQEITIMICITIPLLLRVAHIFVQKVVIHHRIVTHTAGIGAPQFIVVGVPHLVAPAPILQVWGELTLELAVELRQDPST